jgi:hypothetical protein
VEFEVKDAAGRTLMHSGALQPDGSLDPRAHSFTNRLVNKKGGLNDLHQVWDTRVVAYNNTIQSGRSQIVRYEFKVPADATGPISVSAKINYRRFNQHFIDFGLGKHYEMPVVEIASRTRTPRNGFLLTRNGCRLSATSIPGSKLPACYFASFQVRWLCPFGPSAPLPRPGLRRLRPFHCLWPVALPLPGSACRADDLHSPPGFLLPSGSKRSTAFAACRST